MEGEYRCKRFISNTFESLENDINSFLVYHGNKIEVVSNSIMNCGYKIAAIMIYKIKERNI